MSDLNQVLRLWHQIEASGEDCVLATIVRVDGSSYRKPGARMLITSNGLRAGTISGGCLESEVSKQAWWLTENGPLLKAYSTSFEEDDDRPYGLGCGGTVHLLLERRQTVEPFLRLLARAFEKRLPVACAVSIAENTCGTREVVSPGLLPSLTVDLTHDGHQLKSRAKLAFDNKQSSLEQGGTVWAEFIPARCGLFVFGAGDDAKPLVTQASTLGWHITVADGRSHLATHVRFPEADDIELLEMGDCSGLRLQEGDAAVVMTHSYERDRSVLAHLLDCSIAYLGVLGPRYRTADLLRDVMAGRSQSDQRATEMPNKVHSPVGLDLGGDSPATIALAILAEIQATLSKRLLRSTPIAEIREERSSLLPVAASDRTRAS